VKKSHRVIAARLRALAFCSIAALGIPGRTLAEADPIDLPVASDPVFKVLMSDGSTESGRIRQIGPKGELTLVTTEGPERVIAIENLVKLSREGVTPSLNPEASVVLFPGGDRLYRCGIGGANETHLDVQSYSLGNLSIPLESVLGLVFSLPSSLDSTDALIQRVRNEPRTSEVLWLANQDRLAVGYLGLSDKTLEYQRTGAKPEKIERSRVVSLSFDPTLVAYPKPEGPYLELTLSDGSRLGVSGARVEQGQLVVTTRFGARLRVPIAELSRVHARTRSVVYLTDRQVALEKSIPYVGPPRAFRKDATVEGYPFKLAGQEYDRGLGTQSRSFLVYNLEPGDRRFQAVVGLDDRAGPLGNVVFRVMADRDERFVSPPMSAGDAPRALDVDVAGAKRLILITEFGERGGVRDVADWVEARIIR
jgi:hypothetical protein